MRNSTEWVQGFFLSEKGSKEQLINFVGLRTERYDSEQLLEFFLESCRPTHSIKKNKQKFLNTDSNFCSSSRNNIEVLHCVAEKEKTSDLGGRKMIIKCTDLILLYGVFIVSYATLKITILPNCIRLYYTCTFVYWKVQRFPKCTQPKF